MEKVAATGRVFSKSVRRVAAALGCCVVGSVCAQEASRPQDVLVAEARPESPLRLEVNTSVLPRLEGQDAGFQAPRVDLSLLPASRSGLGVAVGMSGFSPTRTAAMLSPGYGPARASMDLGVHYRHLMESQNQIDITAWRRMTAQQDAMTLIQMQQQPVYGARVEMKLAPARKTGFSAERGFIGMQLESGAKISIKRKDGRPMVYYRNTF